MFLSILLNTTVDFGITVALVGFLIVIVSLTFLFAVFINVPRLIDFIKNINSRQKDKKALNKEEKLSLEEKFIEGNAIAAISLALHKYLDELHDNESNIVTIKRVKKAYSPWNSKIYGIAQNWPHK